MTAIRTQRWRAVIEVEFDTRDYPGDPEAATAEIQASWLKRATQRAEQEVNCGRADVRLTCVERVALAMRTKQGALPPGVGASADPNQP